MKKLFLIVSLLLSVNSFSQVQKTDIELQLSTFPPSSYEFLYLGNVREYYNDGSFKMVQKNYYANMLRFEPKDHALYIWFYKDASKSTLTDLMILPYNMIIRTEAFATGFIIDMVE